MSAEEGALLFAWEWRCCCWATESSETILHHSMGADSHGIKVPFCIHKYPDSNFEALLSFPGKQVTLPRAAVHSNVEGGGWVGYGTGIASSTTVVIQL